MMATENDANLELAKALLEARTIAIKIAMEDVDSNLFRLAVLGFDLRLLEKFRTMFDNASDEIFMVNIQLDVEGPDDEMRRELRDRITGLEAKQAQILNAIAIWESCMEQLASRDFRLNFDKGTLNLIDVVEGARIAQYGI